MKKALKISRSVQLLGAVFLILAIVSGATGGLDRGGEVGWKVLLGLILIVGARIHEWLSRE